MQVNPLNPLFLRVLLTFYRRFGMILPMREFITNLISKIKAIELTDKLKALLAINGAALMLVAFFAFFNDSFYVLLGGVWLVAAVNVLLYGINKSSFDIG